MLSYVLSITSLLSGVVSAYAETEREMISVERISEYIEGSALDPEFSDEAEESRLTSRLPFGWPHLGWVTFDNVVLR